MNQRASPRKKSNLRSRGAVLASAMALSAFQPGERAGPTLALSRTDVIGFTGGAGGRLRPPPPPRRARRFCALIAVSLADGSAQYLRSGNWRNRMGTKGLLDPHRS